MWRSMRLAPTQGGKYRPQNLSDALKAAVVNLLHALAHLRVPFFRVYHKKNLPKRAWCTCTVIHTPTSHRSPPPSFICPFVPLPPFMNHSNAYNWIWLFSCNCAFPSPHVAFWATSLGSKQNWRASPTFSHRSPPPLSPGTYSSFPFRDPRKITLCRHRYF